MVAGTIITADITYVVAVVEWPNGWFVGMSFGLAWFEANKYNQNIILFLGI